MNRPLPARALLVSTAWLSACAGSAPAGGAPLEDGGAVSRIVDACLAEEGTWEKLAELCSVAPHRLSGSEGAARAVEWARERMVADGLENVRLEECQVPVWVRGDLEELVYVAPQAVAGQGLPILALGGSVPTTAEGIEGDVMVVKSFEELAARGAEARGKIVLFNRPLDDLQRETFRAYSGAVGQRVNGAAEAARHGAVAAIVRSMTTLRDDVPHTGGMRYREGVERIPTAAVSTNGADEIESRIAAGEEVRLRLRLGCRQEAPATSYNVVGELVGRERPEEIVLIGAHLDAWDVGQGAHDDGGGCAQVMEAARLLKELGLRPRRTIRVVLFMNEENGLGGGRAYYETHRSEMGNHVLAIESDSGAYTPRGFSTDANAEALAILRDRAAPLDEIHAAEVTPGEGGADISPMRASGVPLVGYKPDGQRYFDLHHSQRDTLEYVNRRELELGTAAIASLAWSVAEMEGELPRNPVE